MQSITSSGLFGITAPTAWVAMRDGVARWRICAALRAGGWEVVRLDDAWALLDHLGDLASGAPWRRPPELVFYERDLEGPGAEAVLRRTRRLAPRAEVTLVDADPLRSTSVDAAVARVMGRSLARGSRSRGRRARPGPPRRAAS